MLHLLQLHFFSSLHICNIGNICNIAIQYSFAYFKKKSSTFATACPGTQASPPANQVRLKIVNLSNSGVPACYQSVPACVPGQTTSISPFKGRTQSLPLREIQRVFCNTCNINIQYSFAYFKKKQYLCSIFLKQTLFVFEIL